MLTLCKDVVLLILKKALNKSPNEEYQDPRPFILVNRMFKDVMYKHIMKQYFELNNEKAFSHTLKNSHIEYYKSIKPKIMESNFCTSIYSKNLEFIEYLCEMVPKKFCKNIAKRMINNCLRDPQVFKILLEKKREIFFNAIWTSVKLKVRNLNKTLELVEFCKSLNLNVKFTQLNRRIYELLVRAGNTEMMRFFIEEEKKIEEEKENKENIESYRYKETAVMALESIINAINVFNIIYGTQDKETQKLLSLMDTYMIKPEIKPEMEKYINKVNDGGIAKVFYMVRYNLKINSYENWGLNAVTYLRDRGRNHYLSALIANPHLNYDDEHLSVLTHSEKIDLLRVAVNKNKKLALRILKFFKPSKNFDDTKIQINCDEELVPIIYQRLMVYLERYKEVYRNLKRVVNNFLEIHESLNAYDKQCISIFSRPIKEFDDFVSLPHKVTNISDIQAAVDFITSKVIEEKVWSENIEKERLSILEDYKNGKRLDKTEELWENDYIDELSDEMSESEECSSGDEDDDDDECSNEVD